jgi:hypothetical protein
VLTYVLTIVDPGAVVVTCVVAVAVAVIVDPMRLLADFRTPSRVESQKQSISTARIMPDLEHCSTLVASEKEV